MDYYITSDGELYHYGVKGMKWGVRKEAPPSDQQAKQKAKKRLSTGQKVAIGAAATAGILATAWAGYTVSKAYGRQAEKVHRSAQQMARAMAKPYSFEITKFDRKEFKAPEYARYYKESKSKGMHDLFKKPIREVVAPELKKQGRLITRTATSVRKRVAPDMFDISGPESFKKILDDYKDSSLLW